MKKVLLMLLMAKRQAVELGVPKVDFKALEVGLRLRIHLLLRWKPLVLQVRFRPQAT